MFKEIIKRQQSINSILRYKNITEQDKQQLQYYKNLENYTRYANKFLIFSSLFLLYQRGFFNRRSTYLFKEAILCSSLLGYNYIVEYQTNNYVWKQVRPTIRKYALMKEREFYELKRIEQNDKIETIYEQQLIFFKFYQQKNQFQYKQK